MPLSGVGVQRAGEDIRNIVEALHFASATELAKSRAKAREQRK